MATALRAPGINCWECRAEHYEGGVDAPCDLEEVHPATGELGHWCKYGLVVLWHDNYEALDAFQTLQVFGPEAGMLLLRARLGDDRLVELAPLLQRAMVEYNVYLKERSDSA